MRTVRTNGTRLTTMLRSTLSILIVGGLFHFFLPTATFSQGETTSAIIGQVSDASGAAVPSATVTVANKETGLRRTASTDDSGRFNFPQLKLGTNSVKVEAEGFESQQNDAVTAGLGQKQTVDFIVRARAKESIEVMSEAAILNPENANNSTILNARSLEDLPDPGGDLTYPLQFAVGAPSGPICSFLCRDLLRSCHRSTIRQMEDLQYLAGDIRMTNYGWFQFQVYHLADLLLKDKPLPKLLPN
jgi:hypothetical protein